MVPVRYLRLSEVWVSPSRFGDFLFKGRISLCSPIGIRIHYVNGSVLKLPEFYLPLLPERALGLKPCATRLSFQGTFEGEEQVPVMCTEQTPCRDMVRWWPARQEKRPHRKLTLGTWFQQEPQENKHQMFNPSQCSSRRQAWTRVRHQVKGL